MSSENIDTKSVDSPKRTLPADERRGVIENILNANPCFDHPIFRDNLDRIADQTQVCQQRIEGYDYLTVFFTHDALPSRERYAEDFSFSGTARFFKSVTFTAGDYTPLSIGVPHFFSFESFTFDHESRWKDYRFVEKHDGTCLLVTKLDSRFLVRSRRRIYAITDELSMLNMDGYNLGTRLQSLFDDLGERPCSVVTEAIFPHPAHTKAKLSPFYERVSKHSGFCPYVSYPGQTNFVTGIVEQDGFRLMKQDALDTLCLRHDLKRPKTIDFKTPDDAKLWLKNRQNAEGFCVYFDDDQSILKYKTHWYKRVFSVCSQVYVLLKGQERSRTS